MVCDPFTFPAGDLLAHLNQHVPGATVMGGMASGGLRSGQSLLFLDDRVVTHGAVGAHLPRARIRPLVAQGCRPVGDPYTVTQADGNLIIELGGRPPLARLRELAAALPVPEQELLARGAHLGIVIDEYRAEPGQGDFLVRGIAGADPESGAIAVGGELEVGQTVQFHVRDARSADEDLRRILVRETASLGGRPLAGALLFTCTGRGTRMFAEPDHDTGLLAQVLGQVPLAGFFCDGELGTGGRAELPAHLHRVHRPIPGDRAPGRLGQRGAILIAPSSRIVSPLSIGFSTMCAASAAYSAGWPSRAGCGTCAPIDWICSSDRPPSSGVWNRPGAIVITRIFSRARSRAIGSVMPTMPPLDAE